MLSATAPPLLAFGIRAGLGLSLVLWGVAVYRRFALTPAQACLYLINVVFTRLLWHVSVKGRLPELPGQGAVVVCNHRAGIDPCFLEVATRQVVHWMVAKEYCLHWSVRWFFNMAEVIPVDRSGTDTTATKTAIRYAQNGGLVGLFPEGRINTTSQLLLPGRPGAALIALRARVPVIPCYISGSPYSGSILGCLVTPAKVEVRIGRPINLSEYHGRQEDREVVEQLTRRLLKEIAQLAGHPEFEPQLAGRFQPSNA